MGISAEDVAHK